MNETDEIRAFYNLQNEEDSPLPFEPSVLVDIPLLEAADPVLEVPPLGHPEYILDALSPVTSTQSSARSATGNRTYTSIPSDSLVGLAENKSTSDAAFSLRNPAEVRLMKYYLEHMCHWVGIRFL